MTLNLDFQQLRPFYSLSQPHHVAASLPSPGDETTRAREGGPEEQSAKQKWPNETHSVTYVPWLSIISDLHSFRYIVDININDHLCDMTMLKR